MEIKFSVKIYLHKKDIKLEEYIKSQRLVLAINCGIIIIKHFGCPGTEERDEQRTIRSKRKFINI